MKGVTPVLQASFFQFMALRFRPYDLDETDHFQDPSITGVEGALLFGKYNGGFRIFGGPGFFTEDYEDDDADNPDRTFSGVNLNVGLGWDWNYVTMDLHVTARQNVYGDYFLRHETDPDFFGTHEIGVPYSAGVNVSFQI
jgi:hypothetical protein